MPIPGPIRIVVVTTVEGLEQDWISTLANDAGVEIVARMGVLSRGLESVEQLQPTALILDRAVDEIEEAMQHLYAAAPHTLVLALLPQQDMASVRRLVTAGARDILVKPLRAADVITSLRSVVQTEEARRQRAQLPALMSTPRSAQPGKVIVVMGAKGGVGTSTVATNVAVALRQVTGQDVALADFSLQFGDVAALLNVWSKHSLHDVAVHHQTIDDTLLHNVLVPHESGVKVLQAPSEPELAADITGAQVENIVSALQQRFGYVVLDCWSFMDEIALALMGAADQVLLVTTPEVPALKNTRIALDYFVRHGIRRDRIALVLNRFPSVKGVTLKDVQEHLRHPIQANLPSDGPAVTFAGNKGVPVIMTHPQSWVAQSFKKLAAWLAGDNVQTITQTRSAEERSARSSKKSQPSKLWMKLRGNDR